MPVGTCRPSAKTVQRSALPSSLASSRINTLSLGFVPGRYIGYDGMVVTQSRPLASKVIETGSSSSGNSTSDANRLIA